MHAILTDLCSIPTAPFAEDRVYAYVDEFVRRRPKLKLSRDRFGNRLIELRGASPKPPRLVFVAHTDHPGFVATRMLDDRTLAAEFHGAVLNDYVKGAKVRFFDCDAEINGVVESLQPDEERPQFPSRGTIRVRRAVRAGSPGMFDQGVGRVSRGKFFSRVCDDLAGAAAAMEMLDQLQRDKSLVKSTVAVLLTRAEEVGFVGAIAAAKDRKLLRKTDRLISIECSPEQPFARQGDGVILRVGDRTSVFDSGLSFWMNQQAEQLGKRDKSFRFQRALMPGGSCEGTAFDCFGYTAAAVCVPLGNYHNMDRKRKRIAPEYVDLADWRNMVKLFVGMARNASSARDGLTSLRQRLEKRYGRYEPLLMRGQR